MLLLCLPSVAVMDAQPPPPPTPAGGAPPPGKGDGANQAAGPAMQLVDIFGADLWPAALVMMLLLLNLMSASMTRCVCL